jgi:hypothetical protein
MLVVNALFSHVRLASHLESGIRGYILSSVKTYEEASVSAFPDLPCLPERACYGGG